MNNEKMNQIIELAWKKYANSHYIPGNPNGKLLSEQLVGLRPMMHNRETFRKEIIKNFSFASQWGLKIEERELSWKERVEIARKTLSKEEFFEYGNLSPFTTPIITYWLNQNNIPTKLITITYNGTKIESYEN